MSEKKKKQESDNKSLEDYRKHNRELLVYLERLYNTKLLKNNELLYRKYVENKNAEWEKWSEEQKKQADAIGHKIHKDLEDAWERDAIKSMVTSDTNFTDDQLFVMWKRHNFANFMNPISYELFCFTVQNSVIIIDWKRPGQRISLGLPQ